MNSHLDQVDQLAAAIDARLAATPRLALILGSGLGQLADALEDARQVAYSQLPHLPRATALGHAGELVAGRLAGVDVLAMKGRFHLYEGHQPWQVTLLLRAIQRLGATHLVVTNAAGGLNPLLEPGDLMVIEDQVNLAFRNPLVGVNDPRCGDRYPDMSAPYDRGLAAAALAAARHEDIACQRGTYVGVLGPTYETRAEYRFLRRLGGDAVGMSTVAETIVASQLRMKTLGLSLIANVAVPDKPVATSGAEVIAVVAAAADKARRVVLRILHSFSPFAEVT